MNPACWHIFLQPDLAQLYSKIAIWGSVSTRRDLPVKTPEEIRQVTHELLAALPHGGLLAAPAHSVPFDVPP